MSTLLSQLVWVYCATTLLFCGRQPRFFAIVFALSVACGLPSFLLYCFAHCPWYFHENVQRLLCALHFDFSFTKRSKIL